MVIAKESKNYTFFTAFVINYVIPKKIKKRKKKRRGWVGGGDLTSRMKRQQPLLTLFGVPEAVGDENTFPFSHMLLMLRTPSAGTGRSEAAGFVGFAAFVP